MPGPRSLPGERWVCLDGWVYQRTGGTYTKAWGVGIPESGGGVCLSQNVEERNS